MGKSSWKGARCAGRDCNEKPTWQPRLGGPGPVEWIGLRLYYCDQHRAKATVRSVLADLGYSHLRTAWETGMDPMPMPDPWRLNWGEIDESH